MRNLSGQALETYKSSLKLTKQQRDIIIGTILGDATFGGLRNGKPFYGLEFTQSTKHEAYLLHLYEIFEPFTGSPPLERILGTHKSGDNIIIKFRTYRHNCFIFYHKMFNKIEKGKLVKIVPKNIQRFLTARALAYWFMDDGTSQKRSYQFCTDCFTINEHLILQKALLKNFNIKVNIIKYKQTHRLQVSTESVDIFVSTIKPFVVESMTYKIKDN